MVKNRHKKPALKSTGKNPTKERLNVMTKNGAGHRLRTTGRIIKYGASGFKRNIWLSAAATLVMTFTLVVLFITVIASAVLSSTAQAMREKIDITIFFKPGTTSETLGSLAGIMWQDENVKDVTTATTEDEFKVLISEDTNSKELLGVLDDPEMKEIMMGTLQSTMRIKVHDPDDLSSIKNTVNTNPIFVENLDTIKAPTYSTNNTAIETITSWANIARTGGLALSIVFLVISILVIFNTIRMAIFSRREEIYMEKLVGADNHFIRGPFLVEAIMSGLLAGVLGCIIGFTAYHIIAPRLADYDIDISYVDGVLSSSWLLVVILAMLFSGALIGFISSRLAVRKYLK